MATLEQQISRQVYASGETVTDIARSLGCDRAHLHRVMKGAVPLSKRLRIRIERYGFTFQDPGPPPPPDPVEQVRIIADQAIQEAEAGNAETALEFWKAGKLWCVKAQEAGHPCKDDAQNRLNDAGRAYLAALKRRVINLIEGARSAKKAGNREEAKRRADLAYNWAKVSKDQNLIEATKSAREDIYVTLNIAGFKFGRAPLRTGAKTAFKSYQNALLNMGIFPNICCGQDGLKA